MALNSVVSIGQCEYKYWTNMFMLWVNRNSVLNRQYYDDTNSITCRDLTGLQRYQMILLDDRGDGV